MAVHKINSMTSLTTAGQLNMVSYNCSGFNNSELYLKEFVSLNKCDVLCLQETWLLDVNMDKLSNIHPEFSYCGISGVDSSADVLLGRPHGGVSVLWRKSLDAVVSVIKCDNRRLSAIKLSLSAHFVVLIICLYLPCDNQRIINEHEEFTDVLNDLELLLQCQAHDALILCGDFNTSFDRNNSHTRSLTNFMQRNCLKCVWNHVNVVQDSTYVNLDLNQESCIDHYILTHNLYECVLSSFVYDSSLNPSHHRPVHLCIKIPVYHCDSSVGSGNVEPSVDWAKVNDFHIKAYQSYLDSLLADIDINDTALHCKDVNCNCSLHTRFIDNMCDRLISACICAGSKTFPNSSKSYRNKGLPLWNEEIAPYREKAILWHNIWISCGRPRKGAVYDIMRQTRNKYHYAVRKVKRSEENIRKQRFLSEIESCNVNEFWSKVRKFGGSHSNTVSNVIDGKSNPVDICNVFSDKYSSILQSSPSSVSDLNSVKNIISEKLQSDGVEQVHVTDVMSAFKKLNPNKSDGIHGCNSSHIKFASKTFIIYFSLLYQCMLYHGYTADDLLCSCIISIPKDKRGSLNDSSNYRGIALCNALCKVIDLWALSRLETNLITSNLQFAFKPNHSTLMCTTVLKDYLIIEIKVQMYIYVKLMPPRLLIESIFIDCFLY